MERYMRAATTTNENAPELRARSALMSKESTVRAPLAAISSNVAAKRRPLSDKTNWVNRAVQKSPASVDDMEDEIVEETKEDGEIDEEEEDDVVPMTPLWDKEIYGELKQVLREFSRKTVDIDDEDNYDVTMVTEYAPEIFAYLHELEIKFQPSPKYMSQQDELTWESRSTLINWIVQIHERFKLLPETLYLTVNCIDRFLSRRMVSLSRFQLVGAVALFIAAKYEEINCPSVKDIAYMISNEFSVADILKAEHFMIDILEFDMGWPGPMSFLRRTSKADDYDNEVRTLAKYFLEICIMDPRFVASEPSWLASGAHFLSRRLLERGEWTSAHVFYSGYTAKQLIPLADAMIDACRDPKKHHPAIFEKYREKKYYRSADFVQEWIKSVGI